MQIVLFSSTLFASLHFASASFPAATSLQPALQEMISELVRDVNAAFHLDVAMQVGWSSATETFAVGAGKVMGLQDKKRLVGANDTFLFGSGTKSVTAAAVMRLSESGIVQLGNPVRRYIDPYLSQRNGTTLEDLFGPAVASATVLDIIRMSAGIPDFELVDSVGPDPFDDMLLKHGDDIWPPYIFLRRAAEVPIPNTTGHLYCAPSQEGRLANPGNCSLYSSTSFVAAGLLLASVVDPLGHWWDIDLAKLVLHDPERFPSMSFPTAQGHLREHLSVPGKSASGSWEKTTIFEQNPSMLGYTCGNMVGSARDVAQFFFDLLDPDSSVPIVNNQSRAEMSRFKNFTKGYGANTYQYGAGLFLNWATMNSSQLGANLTPQSYGYVMGHGGFTYGFASYQGYIPALRGALSVVVNTDFGTDQVDIAGIAQCRVAEIATKLLKGQAAHLNCTVISAAMASEAAAVSLHV